MNRRWLTRALAAGAVVASLGVAPPADAGTVEASVLDDKGKPVEDAVVYLVAPTPRGAAGRATLDQQNKEFLPHVLPVVVGAAVTFPNNDNIRHNVYSVSPAKKFELPLYIGTPAAPVVFDKPGVVVLGCNIHDWMLAYVYILSTPYFAKTGADGRARVADVPAGVWEVRVWHPRQRDATEKTGQPLTLADGDTGPLAFKVRLKGEWRVPRREGGRYEHPQH